MAAVPKDQLVRRLAQLSITQQSIEQTASWCIFYRKDAKGVVSVWDSEFAKASPEKKLALFYLANHIIQESKKKGREFIDEFWKVLVKAVRQMAKAGDEKLHKSLMRTMGVWEERKIFGSSQMRTFKEAVSAHSGGGGGGGGGGGHVGHQGESGHGAAAELRKKLQHIPPELVDAIWELKKAEETTSVWATKSLGSLRHGLQENGTVPEMTRAIELLKSYQGALDAEITARAAVVTELDKYKEKQEDTKARSQDQLRLCQMQQQKLQERIAVLQQAPAPPPSYPPPQAHPTGFTPTVPQAYQPPPPPQQQQSTPTYAQPAVSPPKNDYAGVPVTQLTGPDGAASLLASLPNAINSLAGVLNGGGLNIPSIAPAAPPAFPPMPPAAAPQMGQPFHPPTPASPQAPQLEVEYSPGHGQPSPAADMAGGLQVEDVDPNLLATLVDPDLLAKMAETLAAMPAEEQAQLNKVIGMGVAAQVAGGDDDEEYNPEFGE